MSKYNAVWEYVSSRGEPRLLMTFDEIRQIAGLEIDHSFLTYKKELIPLGYAVGKISLKAQTVEFRKIET